MRYLLEAFHDPTEISIKRFLAHPLQSYTHRDLQNEELISQVIESFQRTPDLHTALRDLFTPRDLETYGDFLQLSELILENPDCPLEFLAKIPRRTLSYSDAVTIMTIHMSKGLEFNIVFALGLINRYTGRESFIRHQKEWVFFDAKDSKCQAALRNQDAEKMRQLYVAFTRAKKRLYVPLLIDTSRTPHPLGQASPLELFDPKPESLDITYLKPQTLTPPLQKLPSLHPPQEVSHHFPKHYLHSYTSLAHPKSTTQHLHNPIETNLLKGAETGILFHSLFETIFNNNIQDTDIPSLLKKTLPPHFPFQIVHNLIANALHTPLTPIPLPPRYPSSKPPS